MWTRLDLVTAPSCLSILLFWMLLMLQLHLSELRAPVGIAAVPGTASLLRTHSRIVRQQSHLRLRGGSGLAGLLPELSDLAGQDKEFADSDEMWESFCAAAASKGLPAPPKDRRSLPSIRFVLGHLNLHSCFLDVVLQRTTMPSIQSSPFPACIGIGYSYA